jgi:hypothetical protein
MKAALTAAFYAAFFCSVAAQETHALGSLHNITCASSGCQLFAFDGVSTNLVPLRLTFWGPSVVQYWLALDYNFSDIGAAKSVIVGKAAPLALTLTKVGGGWEVTPTVPSSPSVVARLQSSPLQLTLLVDGQVVVTEAAPLAWDGSSSWQTLARDVPTSSGPSQEYFFGAGMQNGRWSHRDTEVDVAVDYNWDDGGHPNSVPQYMSTNGYSVLRNTWAPGHYSFASPVVTSHNESNRFDAFYLLAGAAAATSGGTLKALLGLYTQLTGPPFLPPLYGLFLGDSDCYHDDRHGNNTYVAVEIGKLYEKYDMPRGWLLPNDGCVLVGWGEGGVVPIASLVRPPSLITPPSPSPPSAAAMAAGTAKAPPSFPRTSPC